MPKEIRYFTVKDAPGEKGEVVFEGTIREVANKLCCSYAHIYTKCDTNLPMINDYYIYSSGKVTRNIKQDGYHQKSREPRELKPKPKQVKKTKSQLEYERILKHLDIYGNTGTSKDPIKRFGKNAFERDGYIVKIEHRPKRVIKGKGYTDTEIWDEIWIITLLNKTEVNTND